MVRGRGERPGERPLARKHLTEETMPAWKLPLLTALVLTAPAACASGPRAEPAAASHPRAALDEAALAKLDPPLRRIVREVDENERVPVSVQFDPMPSSETLMELLLVRQGERAVGQVTLEQLRRIASRPEVRAVRYLDGVGYSG